MYHPLVQSKPQDVPFQGAIRSPRMYRPMVQSEPRDVPSKQPFQRFNRSPLFALRSSTSKSSSEFWEWTCWHPALHRVPFPGLAHDSMTVRLKLIIEHSGGLQRLNQNANIPPSVVLVKTANPSVFLLAGGAPFVFR